MLNRGPTLQGMCKWANLTAHMKALEVATVKAHHICFPSNLPPIYAFHCAFSLVYLVHFAVSLSCKTSVHTSSGWCIYSLFFPLQMFSQGVLSNENDPDHPICS
jgi:hypothetical protein